MPLRIPQLPDYHYPVVVIEHPPKPRPPRQKPPRTPRQPHPPRGGHRHSGHSGHSGHSALGSILSQLHHGARHGAHLSGSVMGSLRSAHGHGKRHGPYSPHAGGTGPPARGAMGVAGNQQPTSELQAQEWQALGLNVTYTPPPNPTGVQKWHFGGHGAGSAMAQQVKALAHPHAPHQRAHHPRHAPHVSHHLPHHPSQTAGSSTHHAAYHPPIHRTPPHRHV